MKPKSKVEELVDVDDLQVNIKFNFNKKNVFEISNR